jgi:predicted nucleic acid-binding protein
MAYLIDTCILLRAFERDAAEHGSIIQAIRSLWERDEELFVTVQNIAEFWNVATRPADKNGLGLSSDRVVQRVLYRSAKLTHLCSVIVDHRRDVVGCCLSGVE